MLKYYRFICVFTALLLSSVVVHADDAFSRFQSSVFEGELSQRVLWLKADSKAEIADRFDYKLNRLRVRYWAGDEGTAWVLEEVGKEKPITMAIAVKKQSIAAIEVLKYRESRGGEIQYPFFRDQFTGATLTEKSELNQRIDGITGATLSVRAMTKVAKVALFLDQLVAASGP